MTITTKRPYPRTIACTGGDVEVRFLKPGDEAALLAFAQRLTAHDLLFLRRDISQPKVVTAWMQATAADRIVTLLAFRGDAVVACATVVVDDLSWSRHVGELRVIVEASMRGQGLGQTLTQECFAVALEMGLEKLTAQMTVDQAGAISVFESLGFRPEALLRDQVKDRDGRKHDIVVLGHEVAKFAAQLHAYGVDQAF
jgi:RimJ/RimL family protein N-acetyltransferase